jgi:hypothetical protein
LGEGPLETEPAISWALGFLLPPLREALNHPEKHHPEILYGALKIIDDLHLNGFFDDATVERAFLLLQFYDDNRPSEAREGMRDHLYRKYEKKRKTLRWGAQGINMVEKEP